MTDAFLVYSRLSGNDLVTRAQSTASRDCAQATAGAVRGALARGARPGRRPVVTRGTHEEAPRVVTLEDSSGSRRAVTHTHRDQSQGETQAWTNRIGEPRVVDSGRGAAGGGAAGAFRLQRIHVDRDHIILRDLDRAQHRAVIGSVAQALLTRCFMGGIMLGLRAIERDGTLRSRIFRRIPERVFGSS